MSFLYPLGLLGLIGVPILILIYILKNKYVEQTVSSTYIWTLSEKFFKNKRPISKIYGLISLIIQILIVVVASLAIAQPRFTLKNKAKEYLFVLDGSASMNISNNGITRLDSAKTYVKDLIDQSVDGSTYTLVYSTEEPRVVYEKETDKEQALKLLNNLECSYTTSSCLNTLAYAQERFNANTSVESYLLTDKEYTTNNINLVNLSNNELNSAVTNLSYKINAFDTLVSVNVCSYSSDQELNVALYVDDTLVQEKLINALSNVDTLVEFSIENIDFSHIKAVITNNDSLSIDNERVCFNLVKEHENKALLVSDRPAYLEYALKSINLVDLKVIPTSEYKNELDKYGLYIFDSYNDLDRLPSSGTVWMFNMQTNIPDTNFTMKNVVELGKAQSLTYADLSTNLFKTLTKDMNKSANIQAKSYIQYGIHRSFTTILECEGNPVVFTGQSTKGNREVVFGLDLEKGTDFAAHMDFLILLNNLITYSFPEVIEEASYTCGDILSVNVLSGCDSIKVVAPSNNQTYLSTNDIVAEYELKEVGTHQVIVTMGDVERTFNVYSSIPAEETHDTGEIQEMSLQGDQGNELSDGIFRELLYLFIILAVIFVADWAVYCYEQYQLR